MKPDPSYAEAEQAALDRFAVEVASTPSAHPQAHVDAARARLARPAGLPSMSPAMALSMIDFLRLHQAIDGLPDVYARYHALDAAIAVVRDGDEQAVVELAEHCNAPEPGIFAGPEGNARAREALEAAQAGKYDEWWCGEPSAHLARRALAARLACS